LTDNSVIAETAEEVAKGSYYVEDFGSRVKVEERLFLNYIDRDTARFSVR